MSIALYIYLRHVAANPLSCRLYIIYDVLAFLIYKFLCAIFSRKMANTRWIMWLSFYVQIICNIVHIVCSFIGSRNSLQVTVHGMSGVLFEILLWKLYLETESFHFVPSVYKSVKSKAWHFVCWSYCLLDRGRSVCVLFIKIFSWRAKCPSFAISHTTYHLVVFNEKLNLLNTCLFL
jgi:hypothetical protein